MTSLEKPRSTWKTASTASTAPPAALRRPTPCARTEWGRSLRGAKDRTGNREGAGCLLHLSTRTRLGSDKHARISVLGYAFTLRTLSAASGAGPAYSKGREGTKTKETESGKQKGTGQIMSSEDLGRPLPLAGQATWSRSFPLWLSDVSQEPLRDDGAVLGSIGCWSQGPGRRVSSQ